MHRRGREGKKDSKIKGGRGRGSEREREREKEGVRESKNTWEGKKFLLVQTNVRE